VYRMHSLVPDDFLIRAIGDPQRRDELAFLDLAGLRSRDVLTRKQQVTRRDFR
jgi:hypothetical protein